MRLNLLLRSEKNVIDELKKEREKVTVKKNKHCKSKPLKESWVIHFRFKSPFYKVIYNWLSLQNYLKKQLFLNLHYKRAWIDKSDLMLKMFACRPVGCYMYRWKVMVFSGGKDTQHHHVHLVHGVKSDEDNMSPLSCTHIRTWRH